MYSNELHYDKQKYREMLLEATETVLGYFGLLLEATETVLGYFGLDRTIYDAEYARKTNRKWWYELAEERFRDIERENMKKELI